MEVQGDVGVGGMSGMMVGGGAVGGADTGLRIKGAICATGRFFLPEPSL